MIIKGLIYPGIYPRSVVVGFIFFPPQNSRENKVCFLNFCSAQMVGKKIHLPKFLSFLPYVYNQTNPASTYVLNDCSLRHQNKNKKPI